MLNLSLITDTAVNNAPVLLGSADPTVINDLAALTAQQFQLIPTNTSHEILHFIQKNRVELIILDLDSLGPDGILAAKVIRSRSQTRHVPMIMLSRDTKLPLHVIDGCNGCIDHVTKPYNPEILLWKIVSFLRMQAYLKHIKDCSAAPHQPGTNGSDTDQKRQMLDYQIESFIHFNSSRLSNQLAACIAHEIKNPITIMHALLEVATLSQEPLSLDKIDVLLGELQRLNTIVSNFMDICKNQRSARESQHLEEIVEGIKPMLEAKCTLENKAVVYDLNPCPPVLVNYQDIVQLILNLALNGLEAMADQGANLVIATEFQEGKVLLKIADEGPGIPEPVLNKIWDPFYTTKPTGSGLGLVICRALAERNGALISVDSTSSGTTFTVSFPPLKD
ncbi:MAG TPA: hybrid sensor histidine kinase/response regulator [Limnochordia bacterium]|nr:hybrid sensor histidine kinase/response regulator [Limnochordia bacterium]